MVTPLCLFHWMVMGNAIGRRADGGDVCSAKADESMLGNNADGPDIALTAQTSSADVSRKTEKGRDQNNTI